MPAQKKDINLLPKESWETGNLGKLITWILSIGRYVVIFTELIVISCFLYRFGLDRQLTDLNEEIRGQREIIDAYGDFETKFRLVQKQLATIKTIQNTTLPINQILNTLSQITPTETTYESIVINEKLIELRGSVLSEMGLATLLAKAQDATIFSEVILENVASDVDKNQLIKFRLTLNLAKIKL